MNRHFETRGWDFEMPHGRAATCSFGLGAIVLAIIGCSDSLSVAIVRPEGAQPDLVYDLRIYSDDECPALMEVLDDAVSAQRVHSQVFGSAGGQRIGDIGRGPWAFVVLARAENCEPLYAGCDAILDGGHSVRVELEEVDWSEIATESGSGCAEGEICDDGQCLECDTDAGSCDDPPDDAGAGPDDGGSPVDGSVDSGPPVDCGLFGEVVDFYEDPSMVFTASYEIAFNETHTLVTHGTTGSGQVLSKFGHDLSYESSLAGFLPSGNAGIAFSPADNVIYSFTTVDLAGEIYAWSGDGSSMLLGPVSSTTNSGSGFVDDVGHLHLVQRMGPGVYEFDSDLDLVGMWAMDTGSVGLRDAKLGPDGRAYLLSGDRRVLVYDFTDTERPQIDEFDVEGNAHAIAIDDQNVLYVVGFDEFLRAYSDDGALLGSVSWQDETAANVAFNEHSGLVYVSYWDLTEGRIRSVRPCRP